MSKHAEKKPSLWQVIKSVLSAMFGVQSSAVHKRDFTHGNPWAYVVVGIVVTVLFVLTLWGIVHWILFHVNNTSASTP